MPSQLTTDEKPITPIDFDGVVEQVCDEHGRRKRERQAKCLDQQWDEIDRQIRMEPNRGFKKLPDGKVDRNKQWMSEVEPPLQAQALEILVADARRFMFPSDPWFRAHAETTDAYLNRMDSASLVLGDENDVPSAFSQDNADKLVEGFLIHQMRQYDFFERFDRINAGAFCYGMGVGRMRMERKNAYIHEAKGTLRETQKLPVVCPGSIRNLYLDDPMPSMHTVERLEPAHIAVDWVKLEALKRVAGLGSNDPDEEDGGWMKAAVNNLDADRNGYVQILEMEGDIIIPQREGARSLVARSVIATVAVGAKKSDGKVSRGLIRLRFRKMPFSSWLLHAYHYENPDDVYPTGPLMKGRPLQIMAAEAMNRLMDAAALKNQPPVGYDKSDTEFAQKGGPAIFPGAQWGTIEEVRVYDEIGGEPAAMSAVLQLSFNAYSELTGILPSRLGAQTISHTTAFAKDAELNRGAVRTIDYVTQSGKGPLTRFLDMSYRMGRASLGSNETMKLYIEDYSGFVEINKAHLPDKASFQWFGSGGPAEEQAVMRMRSESLQMALQIDTIKAQYAQSGVEPTVDFDAAIRQVLREGKWPDVDAITNLAGTSGTGAPASGIPGADTGADAAALATVPAEEL